MSIRNIFKRILQNFEEKIIDDYTILKTIGEGTFGKVKLGIHKPTNEHVAIKIFEKSKFQSENDISRMKKEILFLKKFNHPNIIRFYDIIEDKENFYMIMEYASKGELLNYILSKKKLNETEAANIFCQLITGIEFIHKYKIAHRDIKPENLLLKENNILVIIDFGLSNEYNNEKLLSTPCGSPYYAAPEMILGKKYNGLISDIWSSGIVLYTMICGKLPFEEKSLDILYKKILTLDYEIPENISNDLKDLMKKIFCINPKNRINIDGLKSHPYLVNSFKNYNPNDYMYFNRNKIYNKIINYMINDLNEYNYKKEDILYSIKNNQFNKITATYELLLKKFNKNNFEGSHINKKRLNSNRKSTSDPAIGEYISELNKETNDITMIKVNHKKGKVIKRNKMRKISINGYFLENNNTFCSNISNQKTTIDYTQKININLYNSNNIKKISTTYQNPNLCNSNSKNILHEDKEHKRNIFNNILNNFISSDSSNLSEKHEKKIIENQKYLQIKSNSSTKNYKNISNKENDNQKKSLDLFTSMSILSSPDDDKNNIIINKNSIKYTNNPKINTVKFVPSNKINSDEYFKNNAENINYGKNYTDNNQKNFKNIKNYYKKNIYEYELFTSSKQNKIVKSKSKCFKKKYLKNLETNTEINFSNSSKNTDKIFGQNFNSQNNENTNNFGFCFSHRENNQNYAKTNLKTYDKKKKNLETNNKIMQIKIKNKSSKNKKIREKNNKIKICNMNKMKYRRSPDFPCISVKLNIKEGNYNTNDSRQDSNNEINLKSSYKFKKSKKLNESPNKKMNTDYLFLKPEKTIRSHEKKIKQLYSYLNISKNKLNFYNNSNIITMNTNSNKTVNSCLDLNKSKTNNDNIHKNKNNNGLILNPFIYSNNTVKSSNLCSINNTNTFISNVTNNNNSTITNKRYKINNTSSKKIIKNYSGPNNKSSNNNVNDLNSTNTNFSKELKIEKKKFVRCKNSQNVGLFANKKEYVIKKIKKEKTKNKFLNKNTNRNNNKKENIEITKDAHSCFAKKNSEKLMIKKQLSLKDKEKNNGYSNINDFALFNTNSSLIEIKEKLVKLSQEKQYDLKKIDLAHYICTKNRKNSIKIEISSKGNINMLKIIYLDGNKNTTKELIKNIIIYIGF